MASVVARSILSLVPDAPVWVTPLFILLLVSMLVAINYRGVKTGARVIEGITVAKLLPLLAFVSRLTRLTDPDANLRMGSFYFAEKIKEFGKSSPMERPAQPVVVEADHACHGRVVPATLDALLDAPSALPNYLARGFEPFEQGVMRDGANRRRGVAHRAFDRHGERHRRSEPLLEPRPEPQLCHAPGGAHLEHRQVEDPRRGERGEHGR